MKAKVPLRFIKYDFPASLVVFLVALPLCLGIAMASGAPLFSGIISGIIGGIVVGALSNSPLGVSGPAAGLAVIVLNAITDLGGFECFLVAVVIAGVIQVMMGFLKAGIIAYFFPSSVIHGMLAGIGIIIFLKQIPHAFGYDKSPEGDLGFHQMDGHNTFDELLNMLNFISPGVFIIALVSLLILIIWETKFIKKLKFTTLIQGPLVAVIVGILLNLLFKSIPSLQISADHMVEVPISESFSGFVGNFRFPDFSVLTNIEVYKTGVVIAIVASLETLLCVEATDKQDVFRRITPTNRELKAQGVGNILSGLIGGIPVTQVIVRSSANQQSGGKTKASTITHGVLILLSVLFIPNILNLIPLGVLAAILLVVGYKLAKPSLFLSMYKEGWGQFLPFVITVVGIVFSDLLLGISLGVASAIFIILRNNFKLPFKALNENKENKKHFKILLSEDVTFLNKASIMKTLEQLPNDITVEIDGSNTKYIHSDVIEIITNFKINARVRNIKVITTHLFDEHSDLPLSHFKLEIK